MRFKKNIFPLLLLIIINISISSQTVYHDFSFKKDLSVIVKDTNGNLFKLAWAGGLNSCEFSQIDLNMDGKKDLFVFDRHGNKALTFINNGTANSVDYTYAPEYEHCFPAMHDWVILRDFNNDGKEDIFTFTNGGMEVYKNTSDSVHGLKFTLFKPLLTSLENGNYINLSTTAVEYPAISDIDGDGDLDILSFFPLGQWVEYNKNMSEEKYHNADSLIFVRQLTNWGDFMQSNYSNQLFLDTIFYFSRKPTKHLGSTFLLINLENGHGKDLILGDINYPNMVALYNGGTNDSAFMIRQDSAFPSNTKPVNLYSYPQAYYLDVDNDSVNDLLVSPFEPTLTLSENFKSVWYYKNMGTNTAPVFNFQKDNFLQDEMIDVGGGAYPVLFDYDHDGLPDLLVSNYGYFDTAWYSYGYLYSNFVSKIALFKNTGTSTKPEFTLITRDFADISKLKLNAVYPTFGDLDGDGQEDMLIGNATGNLLFFKNIANPGIPANFMLADSNYQNINVGAFSTPQLVDLNNDGLLDLVIGEQMGRLHYYENTGTASNPVFTKRTDSLGGVFLTDTNVSIYGYSVPCFFKDHSNQYNLFAGCELGGLFYYKNIDNNLTGKFTLAEQQLLSINEGTRTAAAVADLDNDGIPDMIIGNYRGGLSYYKGDSSLIFNNVKEIKPPPYSIQLYPNPAKNNLTISFPTEEYTKINLIVYNCLGEMVYQNVIKNINPITLPINNWENGIYFLKSEYMEQWQVHVITRKFIIEH